jgi:hypothetical protein
MAFPEPGIGSSQRKNRIFFDFFPKGSISYPDKQSKGKEYPSRKKRGTTFPLISIGRGGWNLEEKFPLDEFFFNIQWKL